MAENLASHSKNMANLKGIVKKMVHTHFREPWQFRIEVDGYPTHQDFDIYVREITYGPTEIETEQEKVGIGVLTYPSGAMPVTVSMIMRDNEERWVSDWFNELVKKVVNDDGTVNLPHDYCVRMRRFSLRHGAGDKQTDEWLVYPTQLGDVTESKDGEGVLEFPITFVQFRSITKKKEK